MRISKTNPFVARWLFGLVAVVLAFFAYLATPGDEVAKASLSRADGVYRANGARADKNWVFATLHLPDGRHIELTTSKRYARLVAELDGKLVTVFYASSNGENFVNEVLSSAGQGLSHERYLNDLKTPNLISSVLSMLAALGAAGCLMVALTVKED